MVGKNIDGLLYPKGALIMSSVIERFVRYIKIDTESDHTSETNPSTEKQFDLARLLVQECEDLGLSNITLTEKCHVLAELPSNSEKNIPVIGFNAHIDTSPDFSGKGVNPQFIHYQGGDILLNQEENITLSPNVFPILKERIGKHLITTDGTTLLGADDKAGIAEIMASIEYLVKYPEIEHGSIKICFTPDEEIGRGVHHFEYALFGADFAYTVDGGAVGTITYENFNAASAVVTIHGRSIHPGTAKGKMINASRVAIELDAMLPENQKPEYTENKEGFFHLTQFTGNIETGKLSYIIRDHDMGKFTAKKELILAAANYMNQKYGENTVEIEINDSYYNMREKIEPVIHIVDTAIEAMEQLGIEPEIVPIRGGTDGAQMSYKGIPTPNLFTGGYNCHGRFEFAVEEEMEQSVEVILKIIDLYTQKA